MDTYKRVHRDIHIQATFLDIMHFAPLQQLFVSDLRLFTNRHSLTKNKAMVTTRGQLKRAAAEPEEDVSVKVEVKEEPVGLAAAFVEEPRAKRNRVKKETSDDESDGYVVPKADESEEDLPVITPKAKGKAKAEDKTPASVGNSGLGPKPPKTAGQYDSLNKLWQG